MLFVVGEVWVGEREREARSSKRVEEGRKKNLGDLMSTPEANFLANCGGEFPVRC